MRRFLKKLPQNGEKRSQNRENSHKAIYIYMYISIFIRKNFSHRRKVFLNFSHPPKVFLSETLYFELPKNLVICFKRTLASLLLDTTKTQKIRKVVIT